MSVRIPSKKKETLKEYEERISHNRSTLYEYFQGTDMITKMINIGKGRYVSYIPDYKWESVYLLVNGIRFTDFHMIILFSKELVIRFNSYTSQVNIPYRLIDSVQLENDKGMRYEEVYLNR